MSLGFCGRILLTVVAVFSTGQAQASDSMCRYLLSGPPDINHWPQISWDRFSNITDISDFKYGFGSHWRLTATLDDVAIFLKVSSVELALNHSYKRNIEDVKNEAFWFAELSKRGWAPRFYGISYYHSDVSRNFTGNEANYYTLVSEYVEGISVGAYKVDDSFVMPQDFVTNPKAVSELKAFFAFVESHNIFPHDLQLILKADGSWVVVDLEWYKPVDKLNSKEQREFTKYETRKQRLIDYFESHIPASD